MEYSPSIEAFRQQAIAFKKAEKAWKKKAPKGKVYTGFRFEAYQEKLKGGWQTMGYKAVPVYEKRDRQKEG